MIHADNLSNTHIQDNNGHWHIAKPIYVAVKFWSEK